MNNSTFQILHDKICCTNKRDRLLNNEFLKSLHIHPRVLIFEKFTLCVQYEASITVTNKGKQPTRLSFSCDNTCEKKFQIQSDLMHSELFSDQSTTIKVCIVPTCRENMNRTRHIYVSVQHPNVTIDVPIIVAGKDKGCIYVPKSIIFPSCPPVVSYYETVICNYSAKCVKYLVTWCNTILRVDPPEQNVECESYCKILLTIFPIDLTSFDTNLSIKISGEMKARQVSVLYCPIAWSICLSTQEIKFDIPLGHEIVKSLRICNESIEPITYYWRLCNVKADCVDKSDLFSFLEIYPMMGFIRPLSSVEAIFKFSPPSTFKCEDENKDPPFLYEALAELSTENLEPLYVKILGYITGPEICINPQQINCGRIVIGEKNYKSLDIINIGQIPGRIYFKKQCSSDDFHCTVSPESGVCLEPYAKDAFCLMFFSLVVGKFLVQLNFKIESGCHKTVIMRGTTESVKVEVRPDTIEYGVVPFCIPEKRFVTIKNLLCSPIMVQCSIPKNGSENPLIMNVKGDFNKKFPLNMKYIHDYGISSMDVSQDSLTSESNCRICKMNHESALSVDFHQNVIDKVDSIVKEFLANTHQNRPFQEAEAETKIINTAFNCMLDTFNDFNEKTSFMLLDWNALPSDPKEVIFEKEPFYLKSQEMKYMPVILIPNLPGFCIRYLEIHACPLNCNTSEVLHKVDSHNMVTRVRLAYNTQYPQIDFNDDINIQSREIYVDREYPFEMNLRNKSKIPGFIFFKVIPCSEVGEMLINGDTKFYVHPCDTVVIKYSLIFHQVGLEVVLPGLLSIIGKFQPIKFCITATVLPPKIKIFPEKIFGKIHVLETINTHITIANITPTKAEFKLALQNEQYQKICPKKGSLCPNEIAFPIILKSCFCDFGIYKNKLLIHLINGGIEELPICFEVSGIPIIFDFDLKSGFDAGTLFVQCEDYEYLVNAKNCGERNYKINFNKIRPKMKNECANQRAVEFSIEPKVILLEPKSEVPFYLKTDATKESEVISEFIVEAIAENKRFHFFRFAAKAKFIPSKLTWDKREVFLSLTNAIDPCEKFSENVRLNNHSPIRVPNLELKVSGPFRLFDNQKISPVRQLFVSIEAQNHINLTIQIFLDENFDQLCENMEGKIVCRLNNRTCNPMLLKAIMKTPCIDITESNLLIFNECLSSITPVELNNIKFLPAQYRWELINEVCCLDECPPEPDLQTQTVSELIMSIASNFLPSFSFLNIIDDNNSNCYLSEISSFESEVTSQRLHSLQKLSESESKSHEIFDDLCALKERYLFEDQSLQNIEFEELLNTIRKFVDNHAELETPAGNERSTYIEMYEEHDKQSVFFQDSSGCIQPNKKLTTYMFCPPIKKGRKFLAKIKLDVNYSQDKFLDINIVNCADRIKISQTEVNLGSLPWYKEFRENICIENPTNYPIKIRLIQATTKNFYQRLSNGFIEIILECDLHLEPNSCLMLPFRGMLGLSEYFLEDVGIEVENGNIFMIRFHGKGQLPMLNILELKRCYQPKDQIEFEYENLRKIYKEFVNSFEFHCPKNNENNLCIKKTTTKRFDFECINESHAIPNSYLLNRLLETARFLNMLKNEPNLRNSVQKLYCYYVKNLISQVISPKTFSVETVPFEVIGYHLELGNLKINTCSRFTVEMIFQGSDRLILSARTLIIIPGFAVSLCAAQDKCEEFYNFYHDAKNTSSELCPYRNYIERQNVPSGIDMKLCCGHTYDVDRRMKHQRCVSPEQRKKINDHYTKLNTASFKCTKDPLVINELYQLEASADNPELCVMLNIMFEPRKKYYIHNQSFEDYLYLDIHMGPTIPILMHGIIE